MNEKSAVRRNVLGMLSVLVFMCFLAPVAASGAPLRGGTCWANLGLSAALDPSTQIACEIIGKATIAQIYEKGFRVVAMVHHPQHPSFVTILIEEQR